MPIIPSDAPSSISTCRISCNGTPLPITLDLIALDAMQAMDGTGSASLRFSVTPAHRDLDAALQAAPLGAVLEVALGHGTQVQPVFAGSVRTHRLQLSASGAPEMVLEAASHSAHAALQDEVAITVQYGATLLALDAGRSLVDTPLPATQGAVSVLRGQATLTGTIATPGTLLALGGVSDAFGGNVRIVAVHHTLSRGTWLTRIDFSAD
jgi:hypothetical protein